MLMPLDGGPEALPAYSYLLRAFGKTKDVRAGLLVHDYIVAKGLEAEPCIGEHLVDMYVKCGRLEDAIRVFEAAPATRTVLSWNRMIAGHVDGCKLSEAVSLYRQMQLEGVEPNRVTFVTVLSACSVAGECFMCTGKEVHACIVEAGYRSCSTVSTSLVNMYGCCGELRSAIRVFKSIGQRDTAAWTCMIAAYARSGHPEQAIRVYRRMLQAGIVPNEYTLAAVLTAVADKKDWRLGMKLHRLSFELGLQSHPVVATTLIAMFGKCGDAKAARRVWRKVKDRDSVAWNANLVAHLENCQFRKVLRLFFKMLKQGPTPSRAVLLAALAACTRPSDLEEGKRVHLAAIKLELETDVAVTNAVVAMYSRCGSLEAALSMFDRANERNVTTWSITMEACLQHGQCELALVLFRRMLQDGLLPDESCYTAVLGACGSLEEGRTVHACIEESAAINRDLRSELVAMYGRYKCLQEAFRVFGEVRQPDATSWGLLIAAHLECGLNVDALIVVRKMLLEGVKPNRLAMLQALSACSAYEEVCLLHGCLQEMGLNRRIRLGKALLVAYKRCGGKPEDAEVVLNGMHVQDEETFRLVLSFCEQASAFKLALKSFRRRMQLTTAADMGRAELIGLAKACAAPGLPLADAKLVHICMVESGSEADVGVATAVLTMYSRCGSLDKAWQQFSGTYRQLEAEEEADVRLLWNAMILAFMEHGYNQNAFLLFQQMLLEGVMPDQATVVAVLQACARLRSAERGKLVHSEVVELAWEHDPGVASALAVMYAECKHLEAALEVLDRVPEPVAPAWNFLCSAYLAAGKQDQARRLFRRILLEGLVPLEEHLHHFLPPFSYLISI